MKPEVTLTMAAWRVRSDWFRAAVRSALDQRGCDVEVIVVDDGSPEPVADELRGIEDARLRVVRIEHGGTSAARNAGVAHSRGRLIRFLDADDVLEPESTARLAEIIGARDDVLAHGATVVCDEELRPQRTIASAFEGDVVVPCLLGRFSVRHVSMLFPRRVVERAGPWVGGFHISEDWDFVLRTLEHALVKADPEVATLYRRHGGSRTGLAALAVGEEDRLRVIERYFARHPEQRGSRLERRALAAAALDQAAAYVAIGERREAARRLRRAAPRDPMRTAAATLRLAARSLRRPSAIDDM
jgi:glycosyltransferase involved in cell wall biosynthesis